MPLITPETLRTVSEHMFNLPVPLIEKIVRPMLVYLALIILLRVFGKRELAQLNPFDLVVLLSLSNTVQNAIIGDDNSLSGGIIGAVSLLAVNWLLVQLLYRSPRLARVLAGRGRVLIRNGRVDAHALKAECMSMEDLLEVLHRQGFDSFDRVRQCEIEPNGTFYIQPYEPTEEDSRHAELMARINLLTREVAAMREDLGNRSA